jgi:hypothetical protein
MAKKKSQKMTAEERAERDETQRLARERIAIREAREREWALAAERAAAEKPAE